MTSACSHHGLVTQRKRPAVGGGAYLQGQCSACRSPVGPKLRVAMGDPIAQRAPYWLQEKKPTAKKRRQAKTMKSRHWQEIRLERLALDSYVCQSCGGFADQVHHLPSAVYGDEKIEDLISACGTCQLEEKRLRITKAVLG